MLSSSSSRHTFSLSYFLVARPILWVGILVSSRACVFTINHRLHKCNVHEEAPTAVLLVSYLTSGSASICSKRMWSSVLRVLLTISAVLIGTAYSHTARQCFTEPGYHYNSILNQTALRKCTGPPLTQKVCIVGGGSSGIHMGCMSAVPLWW